MTIFYSIKNKNIDELAEWLEKYCNDFDSEVPWWKYWDENYCNKCETITAGTNIFGYPQKHAYCELNGNCKFFKDTKGIPDSKQVIKMWLESEEKV